MKLTKDAENSSTPWCPFVEKHLQRVGTTSDKVKEQLRSVDDCKEVPLRSELIFIPGVTFEAIALNMYDHTIAGELDEKTDTFVPYKTQTKDGRQKLGGSAYAKIIRDMAVNLQLRALVARPKSYLEHIYKEREILDLTSNKVLKEAQIPEHLSTEKLQVIYLIICLVISVCYFCLCC